MGEAALYLCVSVCVEVEEKVIEGKKTQEGLGGFDKGKEVGNLTGKVGGACRVQAALIYCSTTEGGWLSH